MDRAKLRVLFGVLVLLLTVACSDSSDQMEHSQVRVLPDGSREVINSGNPIWNAKTTWRLEEDLRLGKAVGGGPEEFSLVGAVLSDSLGMIYVLDLLSQDIRVFHPTGAFSHIIGQKGDGPGEFQAASGMTFGPGGTLWVVDPRAARYSGFARDGTFLQSYPRPIVGSAGFWPGRFTFDGRYIDWGLAFPEEGPETIAGSRIVFQPFALSSDFKLQDSFPSLEISQKMMVVGGTSLPVPFFSNNLTFDLDANGDLWFAKGDNYRIYRSRLEGDTVQQMILAAIPVPTGEAEREYVRGRMASRPELLNTYLDALPETKPIVHRILSDGAGHIFVIAETTEVLGGTAVDVFRESGEFLGRMALPTPVTLNPPSRLTIHVTPGHLFLVVTDDSDVPYVSRLKIVKDQ